MNIYRHGDVVLKQVEENNLLPAGLPVQRLIVARGEATGHHHLLTAGEGGEIGMFFDAAEETRYLEVFRTPAKLTHEEHKELVIAVGAYEIINERSYDYFEKERVRRAAD